ncbi:MAG: tripartite tricarboxylate transporter permease [Desulfobacterales bacterium]|nr:tripartite tricarboxylate transporter permease [Desulfobacterales bacterium]
MDVLPYLYTGFSIALQPTNLAFCFLGTLLGTVVGILPGIGPIGTMSILLPVTYHISPISSIIMLAGIYYGAMYGGTITSILVNIPGEAASVVTCLDGYQMAKQGRAGPALGIAAIGSFIAGTLGLVGLVFFAGPLSEMGLKFGPPEYFSVVLLGLTLVIYLTHGSALKGFVLTVVGLILSCVGLDEITGTARMTYGTMYLWDGMPLVPIAMGLFGISEIFVNVEKDVITKVLAEKIKNIYPSVQDWIRVKWALVRGTIIGFFLGILPGGGPVVASFVCYSVEKRISKHPEEFGKGAIEGVAGPESANNSAVSGAFIPFLTLGIPPNVTMAMLYGAFLVHGLSPGPFLIVEHPDVFWGLVSSMYIGNAMLLVLNLPLIPLWARLLKVRYNILFPIILLFCIIGAYSIRNNVLDVFVMMLFGIVGYLFGKFGYEPAPLLLAFVLGPMFEKNLRQSLLISQGDFSIFFTRPISAVALSFAIVFFITSLYFFLYKGRKKPKPS